MSSSRGSLGAKMVSGICVNHGRQYDAINYVVICTVPECNYALENTKDVTVGVLIMIQ